jgi:two-component sensor histidine kinase
MKKLFLFDRYEIKIAFIYFIVSVCWIFLSDRLVNRMVSDPELLLSLQTYKGWGFVLVTTFVLYFFINRYAAEVRSNRKRIKELLKEEKSSREQTEQEKEQLEEVLLEAPSAICILKGPKHRFTYANEAYRQLIGDRKLVGHTIREALPELEGQGFFDLLDKVYETGTLYKGSEMPFVVQNDDEQITYYHNFIYKPLLDKEDNCTGIFVEAVDITKQVENRKKLEHSNEEKKILLSELHHRVKNNLAVITSLIELETNEYRDQLNVIPLETTCNRIFAIAEIHEVLFQQQSLKDIPFHHFLDRLISVIFRDANTNHYPNVEHSCSELSLNINQAVPFGLIINEILSRLKNNNGHASCEDVQLSMDINDQGEVSATFQIRQLEQEIKKKITNAEKYLPATLIQVLSQQLDALLEHSNQGNTTLINIQFQKKELTGASSNV